MKVELTLNGRPTGWDVPAGMTLLAALREARVWSVKRGCESGDCGSCTVLLDGQPVNCCMIPVARASGCEVTTIEGLMGDKLMQDLQKALVDAAAVQCGYCSPGMLISLYAHLSEHGELNEETIREALSGNLCRCTGYVKPVAAAVEVARNLEADR